MTEPEAEAFQRVLPDPDKPIQDDPIWQRTPMLPRSLRDARDMYGEDVVPYRRPSF